MRINSIPSRERISPYVYVKEAKATSRASMSADKVEFTNQAVTFSATLKAAKEAMATGRSESGAKVESIQQQLRDNSYQVSGYQVAERILKPF